jgi:hypothetical protein|nr:MAG TPA: hypothetical protein [Caudoviricetes sp.]
MKCVGDYRLPDNAKLAGSVMLAVITITRSVIFTELTLLMVYSIFV